MGRLDDIIARNKDPRKGRRGAGFTMGIGVAIFVFVILVMMVFTDLDESPTQPDAPVAPAVDDGTKRVHGIGLYRARPRAPAAVDAGVTQPDPAPAP